MSAEAAFINEIIEKSDSFIRSHGGEVGYELFREECSKSISINTDINEFALEYIQSIERKEAESPLYARVLLSLYVVSEQNGQAPDFLKDWVFERLIKVSDGASADDAFHLKPQRGVRQTKRQHNRLRCVCYVELKMREGVSKTEAVQACKKEFGADERTIFGFLKGIKIGSDVSDQTLIFYRDCDISNDYFPY